MNFIRTGLLCSLLGAALQGCGGGGRDKERVVPLPAGRYLVHSEHASSLLMPEGSLAELMYDVATGFHKLRFAGGILAPEVFGAPTAVYPFAMALTAAVYTGELRYSHPVVEPRRTWRAVIRIEGKRGRIRETYSESGHADITREELFSLVATDAVPVFQDPLRLLYTQKTSCYFDITGENLPKKIYFRFSTDGSQIFTSSIDPFSCLQNSFGNARPIVSHPNEAETLDSRERIVFRQQNTRVTDWCGTYFIYDMELQSEIVPEDKTQASGSANCNDLPVFSLNQNLGPN